jgi:hypothetical protein
MAENVVSVIYAPRQQIRSNKIAMTPEEGEKLLELVGRAYRTEKPDKQDLDEIKQLLIARPELCKAVFGISEAVQSELIKKLGESHEVAKMAIEEYVINLRDDMGYHEAPIMEKLLIENIVTCWLKLQYCETQLVYRIGGDYSITILEFWERRLSLAERRYLAACETLAKIRKMAIPALQLNIGDKQINVAGNIQSPNISKHGDRKR